MLELANLPTEGVIETYSVSDALGTIRLADGATLRFGRSACTFDPTQGDRVRVVTAEIGPLGRPRATRVESLGPHQLTESERTMIIAEVLLGRIETYGDWSLAFRLAQPTTPSEACAMELLRDELATRRGRAEIVIDEMISHARWAQDALDARKMDHIRVIWQAEHVLDIIDEEEAAGRLTPAEAEYRRERVLAL